MCAPYLLASRYLFHGLLFCQQNLDKITLFFVRATLAPIRMASASETMRKNMFKFCSIVLIFYDQLMTLITLFFVRATLVPIRMASAGERARYSVIQFFLRTPDLASKVYEKKLYSIYTVYYVYCIYIVTPYY